MAAPDAPSFGFDPAALFPPGFMALLDPSTRADPYPLYARVREEGPLGGEGPLGIVVFARHAHCQAILTDPRSSADRTRGNVFGMLTASGRLSTDDLELIGRRPFLLRDPPDHTRLRRLVSKAFTPRVVEGLRPRVQELVDQAINAAGGRGSIEVVGDLAYPVPVTIISELLGVPPEDHERFRGWSADLARSLDPDFGVLSSSPEARDRRRASMSEFRDYFREQIARRRAEPRDDLLSRLVQAEEAGDQLTEDELVSTCVLLLVAGHETTVNLIANGVLALLRHPDQLALLRTDATGALARSSVEEVLRFDPPVHFTSRIPLEPMEVDGTVVPKGGIAVLLLAGANRDPEAFPSPDTFDITRQPNDHLAFGMGAHFCLGAPLARLEGQIALSTLARGLVEPSPVQEPPAYKANFTLRGLESLPVSFAGVRSP